MKKNSWIFIWAGITCYMLFGYGVINPLLLPLKPIPPMLYFAFFWITAFLLVFASHFKISIKTGYILLMLWIPFSICLNQIPEWVQPWLRYLIIVPILFITWGGRSPVFELYRKALLSIIFWVVLLGGVVSFLLYCSNIELPHARGVFAGVYRHSMLLAPLSGIGIIAATYRLFYQKSKTLRMILLPLLVCNIIVLLLSGSRIALFSSVIGSAFVVLSNRKYRKITIALLVLFLILVPSSKMEIEDIPFVENVMEKQESNMAKGSMFTSRLFLWETLIKDIKSSPICGVGFCYSPELEHGESGGFEYGSSWLMIWSTLGIVGLSLLAWQWGRTLYRGIIKLWYPDEKGYGVLAVALMIFSMIHMTCEGYIFSGGSILCFTIWLFLGISMDIFFGSVLSLTRNRSVPAAETAKSPDVRSRLRQ